MRTYTLSAALNNPSLIILGVKKMMNVLFGRTKMMKNTKLIRSRQVNKMKLFLDSLIISMIMFTIFNMVVSIIYIFGGIWN